MKHGTPSQANRRPKNPGRSAISATTYQLSKSRGAPFTNPAV